MPNHKFFLEPQNVKFVKTKNRYIHTQIPAPGSKKVFERLEKVESRSMHGQLPIVWEKAENHNIFDIAGNCWIDFTSTIFVANVGHSNKKVTSAIRKTLDNPLLSCYAYSNSIRANYIEKLVAFAGKPFEKAFLLSAGTEATEAALKLMRMYGQRNEKRKLGIICIENNWHGRTLGAQMMSSNQMQKKWIGYQDEDIHHIPFPYPWTKMRDEEQFLLDGLEKLVSKGIDLNNDICGFMLETFQGWGAIFYPKKFVKAIEKLCKRNNILLTFDEMQSGFARTGKKFGFEHYEVKPDLICTGKGMGGGVPISGVIGKRKIMDLPEIGNMSSTHSANPMVCAAAEAVLDEILDRNLVEESHRKGKLLFEGLNKIKNSFPELINYVLGEGLIAAVLFKKTLKVDSAEVFASKVSEKCMQQGLLVVHTGRESIKIGPPLTITDEALLEGIDVLYDSIAQVLNRDYNS